jgi:hypothetical protein
MTEEVSQFKIEENEKNNKYNASIKTLEKSEKL